MSRRIRLAISTCPNDTYAFHALMHRLVNMRDLNMDVQLLDIQQLNDGLFEDRFDVAKASFSAALELTDRYWVLPSGSALGYGVGPLLLAARPGPPTGVDQLTLCPGQHTTAALLFKLFYANTTKVEHVVFSEIMPQLKSHEADFGVCIHEGRFTWEEQGLYLVEDLGSRWETETSTPLPLGGILASKRLPTEVVQAVQNCILDSLQYARANPEDALLSMRKHAQEFDDEVLMKHVELYVNEWTFDLGATGTEALGELSRRASLQSSDTAHDVPRLEVFS